jgi:hypothetical protein
MYWYVLIHTSIYWYVLVCTCMYWYVLICVDTGFRGSHRDAAMPPPSADQASMEDGDPHPCPEDEEFFECRPDTADMEEAIGKLYLYKISTYKYILVCTAMYCHELVYTMFWCSIPTSRISRL